MASRHISRSIVLQTLFEWDFVNKDNSKMGQILERNIKEFGAGLESDNINFIHRAMGPLHEGQ